MILRGFFVIDIAAICASFGDGAPQVFYYDMTDSTNQRAKEYARSHPENRAPAVFIANGQSAGRGRLGRSFCSISGAGLYISFLLYPECTPDTVTRFTPYAAVALAETVEELTTLSPEIKWVNDLYVDEKKLAGILVECEWKKEGDLAYLVCGLGINVYKTALPDEISDIAISIEEASGEMISREELASLLIKKMLRGLSSFGSEEVYLGYKKRLNTLGQSVRVIKPTCEYAAVVKSLNEDYSLTLTLPDGSEERLFSGEVSVKPK